MLQNENAEIEESKDDQNENKPAFLSRENLYSRINVSVKFMDRMILILIVLLVIFLVFGIFIYK